MSEEGAMLTQQDYARLRSLGQFDTLEAQYFALRARLEASEVLSASRMNALQGVSTQLNEYTARLEAVERDYEAAQHVADVTGGAWKLCKHDLDAAREQLTKVEQERDKWKRCVENDSKDEAELETALEALGLVFYDDDGALHFINVIPSFISALQQQLAAVTQERDVNVSTDRIQAIEAKLREQYPKLNCLSSMWLGFIDHATTILLHDIAAAEGRVRELEADQHAPTVTYWMNMYTQVQQEAKKRFDDWFAIAAERDRLAGRVQELEEACKQQLAAVTQERDEFRSKAISFDLDANGIQYREQICNDLVETKQALAAAEGRVQDNNDLVHILSNHCGESGVSEGAVNTLTRIIGERDVLQGRVRELVSERNRDGLEGQACLDERDTQIHTLTARLAQVEPVCTEILRIMKVYHEQAASPNGVDTPDGLEHMGDVWNLFHKWEHALTPPTEAQDE